MFGLETTGVCNHSVCCTIFYTCMPRLSLKCDSVSTSWGFYSATIFSQYTHLLLEKVCDITLCPAWFHQQNAAEMRPNAVVLYVHVLCCMPASICFDNPLIVFWTHVFIKWFSCCRCRSHWLVNHHWQNIRKNENADDDIAVFFRLRKTVKRWHHEKNDPIVCLAFIYWCLGTECKINFAFEFTDIMRGDFMLN